MWLYLSGQVHVDRGNSQVESDEDEDDDDDDNDDDGGFTSECI